MIGAVAGQYLSTTRKLVAYFDRSFIRFCPAEGKEGARKITLCNFCQRPCQKGPWFCRKGWCEGAEGFCLLTQGINNTGVLMADVVTHET
jgi:hypothetical protein